MTVRFAFARLRPLAAACIAAAAAFAFLACEMPVIEAPACTAARNSIREFYSFHFGNDMNPSQENLTARQRFITPELFRFLSEAPSDSDYFTSTTNDHPKTFRVGACIESGESKADVEVLIFWKDDVRQEQRAIRVKTVKSDDRWLIDNVTGK